MERFSTLQPTGLSKLKAERLLTHKQLESMGVYCGYWYPGTNQVISIHSADHIDGLGQGCSNSIYNALELLQSCPKPLIYALH